MAAARRPRRNQSRTAGPSAGTVELRAERRSMSITVAKYTFSSWLRKGIGNRITEPDNLGLGASVAKERSRVPIDVILNTTPVHKEFALVGPGDIIGLISDMVVRTVPRILFTNFEQHYQPVISLYDDEYT